MSDKSSFAACCQICCFPCYHCLCPEQQNGNKYPHVQYKTPEMANVSVRKLTLLYTVTMTLCIYCSASSIGPPNLNIHIVQSRGMLIIEDLLNMPT